MKRALPLPDRFVEVLQRIPGFLDLTTGFTLCPECERCERSVVFLTPAEQRNARRAGLPLYRHNGTAQGAATAWNRLSCDCPFYESATVTCGIYPQRPLICQLFPLDILAGDDGRYWWVVYEACEEVRRGKLQGRLDELRDLAREIDRRMPWELKEAFVNDADGAVDEPEFTRRPIHYLCPVDR